MERRREGVGNIYIYTSVYLYDLWIELSKLRSRVIPFSIINFLTLREKISHGGKFFFRTILITKILCD